MISLQEARTAVAALALVVPLTAGASDPKGGWEPGFTLVPYGWLAGLDGTVGSGVDDPDDAGITLPPQLEVSTDEEWSEIGFMFYGEWRSERWSVFFDAVWANVSQEADIKLGNLLPASEAEVTFDGNIYQVGIGYLLLDWDRSFVMVYGGGRHYDVDADIKASGGILPDKLVASGNLNWSDAVLGARWSHDFGERWNVSVLSDYGFGDSESAWQVFGKVGYAFSWGSIVAGYRHMNLHYDTSSSTVNLSLSGPFLGASFTL